MITFDADKHEYRENGRVLPSVTQILNATGLVDFSGIPSRTMELAQERGTTVHLITELYDRGELDESTIDPELVGYFEAYKKFLADFRIVRFIAIEQIVSSPGLYAGTQDRLAVMADQKTIRYDIKTGQPHPTHGLQLTAYELADGDNKAELLIGVYLTADGTYKTVPYDSEPLVWYALLRLHKWKTNNDLI